MKQKQYNVPHTFVILFFVVLYCAVLTYMIPMGQYDTIEVSYEQNGETKTRTVLDADSFRYVTDENGNSRSFRSSLLGIKTVSYFSLTVGKAPGTGLDIVVECTDPVLSDLTLTVRTNIRITGRTGATVTRTCETAVTLEAGAMKGRETHVLDLSAGDTFTILGSEMIFARSTSDNGMVEYRNSN